MSSLPFLILLLISLALQVISQNQPTIDERAILLKLKQQLGNPPSLQSWNSTSSPCDWPEIFWEFPRQLYNCTKLQILNLSSNYFVGPIPDDIDRISGLQFVDLGWNNFSGDIPPAIGRLSELQVLYLYQNEFNGTFPVEIGDLSNLRVLDLSTNYKFVPAKIPVEFGKLKNLMTL
ncbi:hypothetical protein Q3G72_010110 [Acer saccharum]|nr:hypothetical protein Q3G72_010110 [Acer saccharum]